MARSPVDSVLIESVDGDLAFTLDQITSMEITRSITSPAEASFEIGDTGSYLELRELTDLGARFRVSVNDRPVLQGRVEMRDAPTDAGRASVLRFVVRTRMTDAQYACASQSVRIKGATLRNFVLECYAGLEMTEEDFIFDGAASRDLLTGRTTRGGAAPLDLAALTEDQAKVRPPETIHAAVDRHLRRHGLMHWDAPDGRIVVAAPDEDQDPVYFLRVFRGAEGARNNVLALNRIEDVSDAPSAVGVFGWGGGRDFAKAKVAFVINEDRVRDRGFIRPVVVSDEGIKTRALAERRATQERARRIRRLDGYRAELDGLAFDDGAGRVPFEVDTVADVITETHGGAAGRYYVESVTLRRDPRAGDRASLTLVGPGSWVL